MGRWNRDRCCEAGEEIMSHEEHEGTQRKTLRTVAIGELLSYKPLRWLNLY